MLFFLIVYFIDTVKFFRQLISLVQTYLYLQKSLCESTGCWGLKLKLRRPLRNLKERRMERQHLNFLSTISNVMNSLSLDLVWLKSSSAGPPTFAQNGKQYWLIFWQRMVIINNNKAKSICLSLNSTLLAGLLLQLNDCGVSYCKSSTCLQMVMGLIGPVACRSRIWIKEINNANL